MLRTLTIALLAGLTATPPAYSQVIPDLDTASLPRPAEAVTNQPVEVSAPVFMRGPSPIAIRLLGITEWCTWGGVVSFDVEVRNVSPAAITLPWSAIQPSGQVTPGSRYMFPLMTLSLGVADELTGLVGHVETLYGDPADPYTVRTLATGAAVVIRVSTTCTLSYSRLTSGLSPSWSPIRVVAEVIVMRSASEMAALVSSSEAVLNISRP
jgi:hypothetical protein